MDIEQKQSSEVSSSTSRASDRRRIRVLWIGLVLYFLIMLNALRYAYRVPYQILILGSLVNVAIILAIIVSIRRVYRRLAK